MHHILILCLGLLFALPAHAAGNVDDVGPAATDAMNLIRTQNGLTRLSADAKLTKAAAAHAKDMIKHGFFSHTGSNGSTIGKRARKQRYKFCVIAENIAKGQRSLEQVLETWMTSPGHRRNILNADVTDFALVRATDNLWVMVLGRDGC